MNGKSLSFLPPWLPPGGSCHDEISASRNRYFVVTDEGWRWLKVLDFSVEWYNLEHTPLIQLHFLTNRSPPLISQPCRFRSAVMADSFPPGEAKYSKTISWIPFNEPLCYVSCGSPSWRPLQMQKFLAISIQRAALLCRLRVAKLATPTVGISKPVSERERTGRVRAVTYPYNPRAPLSGDTVAYIFSGAEKPSR